MDIVLSLPLVYAAWKGFNKGFIIEIFGLLALGVGIYGSIHFSDITAEWLREQFDMKSKYLPIISFSLTFIALVIGVHLLGKMIEKAAHLASLKLVNKVFGAVFSVLKIGLIISVILVVLKSVDEKAEFLPKEELKKSMLFEPMHNFVVWLIPAIEDSELYKDSKNWNFDFLPDQIRPNSD